MLQGQSISYSGVCREAPVTTLQPGEQLEVAERAFLVSGSLSCRGADDKASHEVQGPTILEDRMTDCCCVDTARVRLPPTATSLCR